MAIREVYVGGELDSVRVTAGVVGVDTITNRRDPAFSDMSLVLNIGAQSQFVCDFKDELGAPTTIPTGETIWMHFYGVTVATSSAFVPLSVISDTSGRPCFRVSYGTLGNTTVNIEVNGSTGLTPSWTVAASYIGFDGYLDVGIFTGTTKKVQLFVNGNFISEAPISQVGSGGYKEVVFTSSGTNFHTSYISQILITENKPTVGSRVWTRKPSGAGALQQMAGAYTNLVKTALNDTTAVISNAADQTATYQYQDITIPTGMAMGEVWQWTRTKTDGVSPTNLQSVCRVGSTDYTTANMSGMTAGFNGLPGRWPLNPATTTKWSASTFNAAEFGMKSTA